VLWRADWDDLDSSVCAACVPSHSVISWTWTEMDFRIVWSPSTCFLFYTERESLWSVEITKWISNWTIRYSLITSHVIRGWMTKQIKQINKKKKPKKIKSGILLVFIFRRSIGEDTYSIIKLLLAFKFPPECPIHLTCFQSLPIEMYWLEADVSAELSVMFFFLLLLIQDGVITKAAAKWKMKKYQHILRLTNVCVCLLEIFPAGYS
jgi:hypothetical protein